MFKNNRFKNLVLSLLAAALILSACVGADLAPEVEEIS
jgi:predicted small secreted protein